MLPALVNSERANSPNFILVFPENYPIETKKRKAAFFPLSSSIYYPAIFFNTSPKRAISSSVL